MTAAYRPNHPGETITAGFRKLHLAILAAILCLSFTVRGTILVVTTTASSGPGSLAQAIQTANTSVGPGLFTITFQIPGVGVQTIAGAIPTITATVAIDGTTQTGYAGLPLINLPAGVKLQGVHCVLNGVAIGDTNGALGIEIDSPGGSNTVTGCFIGTGPYGTNFLGLTSAGININDSSGNVIGGTNGAARNLIWAGSNSAAILIGGFSGASSNVIQGNWIGVDRTGSNALPGRVDYGIDVESCASNLIGGAVLGAGNVINGASQDGIMLDESGAANNVIQGNFIGTDPSGLVGMGNGNGILLNFGASSNLIGGSALAAQNVISSNQFSGIDLWGDFFPPSGGGNIVQGNLIGTDITGKKALPNGGIGVFISSSVWNEIGGPEGGAGNLISGNGGPGIYVDGDSNLVEGNIIGLDESGSTAVPNGGNGITLQNTGNQIGGSAPGAGNIISGNAVYGVYEYGGSSNSIQGNFIGTDITGQTALGNTYDGISLDGAQWIVIGGTNAGDGNVIAGNGTEGICLGRYATDTNIIVVSNLVGVAAPPGSRGGSVSARATAHFSPRGGSGGGWGRSGYVPICVSFDNTYGTYPIQILGVNNPCPPTLANNWISDNVFGSCVNSAVDIPNGGSFWWRGNTLISPRNFPPIVASGSPGAPTLGLNPDSILNIGASGPDDSTMTAESYNVCRLGSLCMYQPLSSLSIMVGATGVGSASVNPLVAPYLGVNRISAGLIDPCGGISELAQPVEIGLVDTTLWPGTTAANYLNGGIDLCPVSTVTGELFELMPPDIDLGGPFPLRFQRYYGARIERDGYIAGRLGENWLHNFEMQLTRPSSNLVQVVTQFGRVVQFTNTGAAYELMNRRDMPYQLATNGNGYILGDPSTQILYAFDQTGVLTEVADGHGNAQTLTYSAGMLASVSDGLGRTLTFSYNAGGSLTNVSDGTRSIGFAQSGGLLTESTDAVGNTATYSYDGGNAVTGLLTAAVQPLGNAPFAQTFNSSGQVETQTEAGVVPGITSLSYAENTTTMTDPLGNQTQQSNNVAGQLVSTTDEAGKSITFAYNGIGRRVTATDRLGRTIHFSYNFASGRISAVTNADGTATLYAFTNRAISGITFYDIAEITYPDSATESFTYDANGNVLSHTDRAGEVWAFSYNSHGQILTASNPNGGVVTMTYNPDGTLASQRDSDTGLEQISYDSLRRATNIMRPDGTSLQTSYDADDRVTSTTDELGRVYHYSYDADSNLRQVTDSLGHSISLSYDPRNRLTQVMDRSGALWSIAYDIRGRAVTNTTPAGETTVYSYDSRGRPVGVTDAERNLWTQNFNDESLTVSAMNPESQTYTLERNALNRITNVTDALGAQFNFVRDAAQRITEVEDPLSRSNNFGFDPRDVLSSAAVEGLGAAAYQRDGLGLVTQTTDLNGRRWSQSHTPMGRLQSATDPLNRVTSYGYDNRGRLNRTVFADGTTLSNNYDAAGNVLERQFRAGPTLSYTYDPLDRVLSANDVSLSYDPEGRVTNTSSAGVNYGASYDADGRLITVSYGNGTFSVHYRYDRRGFVTNVTDSLTGASVNLSYDPAERLVAMTRGNGINSSMAYDAAGRLTNVQDGSGLHLQLSLDAVGEIVSDTLTAPLDPANFVAPSLENLQYDAAQQITGGGYTYDARGRRLSEPGHSFGWDGASRLISVDGVSFVYNGLNQLETRAQSGVTVRYFYNDAVGTSPIMSEVNGANGQALRYYVWTPKGQLLYMIDAANGNAVYYYHFDQIGSTLALTSASGAVSDAYAYSPYGILLGHSGSSAQPFTFSGEFGVRAESIPGLYHVRARYYDAYSAAFLSPDPSAPDLHRPQTLNPYAYAARNPLSFYDASGLDARVNQSGPHSDISVDVHDGDKIIGVLTVSFAGHEWSKKWLATVLVWGIDGEITWGFRPGVTVATEKHPDLVVEGGKEADERLTDTLINIIANQSQPENDQGNASDRKADITKKFSTAYAQKLADPESNFPVKGVFVPQWGDWTVYRGSRRNCNDFTKMALETYVGESIGSRPWVDFESTDLIDLYKTWDLNKWISENPPETPPPYAVPDEDFLFK